MTIKKEKKEIKEFEFSLILSFEGERELDPDIADALYEAGCNDALVGSRGGEIHVDFARKARSLADAIFEAIQNIKAAGIGAEVARVDDLNWVTQAEIARQVGVSRSMISQYISGQKGPGGFPAPVGTMRTKGKVWEWGKVCVWFSRFGRISKDVAENAEVIAAFNNYLEREAQRRRNPKLTREVAQRFEQPIGEKRRGAISQFKREKPKKQKKQKTPITL